VAKWTSEHAAMVREHAAMLRSNGYSVFVEGQNAFKLAGKTGVTLAGKPDLVALRDEAVYVIDCKTGLPRHSDQIQVLVYMLILPYVRPAWKQRAFQGRVRYREQVVEIPAAGVDPQFRTLFRQTMQQLSSATALPRVPSYAECRFCDITRHDCPQRIETSPLDIEPEHDLF
jgi:PD-(D/E)XK nuclease superfamily